MIFFTAIQYADDLIEAVNNVLVAFLIKRPLVVVQVT